jgi:hypothetical protein
MKQVITLLKILLDGLLKVILLNVSVNGFLCDTINT